MRLTDSEIAVLNEARTILDQYSDFDHHSDHNEASVATLADIAELMIFKFLNHTSAFLHRDMTYAQLHNAPEVSEKVKA